MRHLIDNILFDLDGTLTDPKQGIVNSILFSLAKLGIKENNIEELDTFIGPPLRESFALRYKLTEQQADNAVSYYREYYAVKGIFENKIYPGITKLLEYLSSSGYRLFVATSKPTIYALKILEHFELNTYFIGVAGSNLDNSGTDKTEIISHVLSEYNLDADRTIMIGDRKHDLIGANNNSIKSIGVTYGYGSQEELSSFKPDFLSNSCLEIESIFKEKPAPATF